MDLMMEKSETLTKLFTALSKFQGELDNASKGKQGHGYKYADLAQCINVAKPVLASNGLAVVQMMGDKDGAATMITMLTHSSGEFVSSEVVMPNATLQGAAGKNPVQVLGSAITYMRRYQFAAIIGLAQEDDDGAINQRTVTKQQSEKPWLNQITDEISGWVIKSIQGGATHDQLLSKLRDKYQISKAMAEQIKSIQVGA